jgi:hypothetical protein
MYGPRLCLWGVVVLVGCTAPNPDYLGGGAGDGAMPDQKERPFSTELDGGAASDGGQSGADAGLSPKPDLSPSPCTKQQDCNTPPGPCYRDKGECDPQTALCTYDPLPAGAPCVPDDPCVELQGATCDGLGSCVGNAISCDVPNAVGGTCVAGGCQGYQCITDWGNCNGDWGDGCEVDLTQSTSHCGTCNNACPAAANATEICSGGQCGISCTPPYEDCNQDPLDGCEIPVGQANSCSRVGLTTFTTAGGSTPGCGTPYCGTGGSGDESFGTWYCTFCNHCQVFDDGGAWCIALTGTFSSDRCKNCCNPNSSQFPQVCAP